FFFSSRRRHTRFSRDWSSDVCSSDLKYRPFTLEGNFAFAAGIQEMLIQSHEDFIRLFPAVPSDWENVSFDGFLTQGAFQVSATRSEERRVGKRVYIMVLAVSLQKYGR